MPASQCFVFVASGFVETWPEDYLVGKEPVILLFECVVRKMFYVFSFRPCVYIRALNLIASNPGPYILT